MRLNQFVRGTEFPPIIEATSWIDNRRFPEELPLIDLSQAVPGYPTSPEILQHMTHMLADPATSKYGPVLGLPALRNAYAQHLNQQLQTRATVNSDNVAITAGCNQAFYVAIAALCSPGDQVILPNPWYFNHKMTLDMLGVEAIALDCEPAKTMIPDPNQARDLICSKTRAIVLISPNNPTGQVYPPETIDAFYHLGKELGVPLLIDETYRDFRPDTDTAAHSIFDDPAWADTAIHLYSFSKAYALAGHRIGALVASSDFLHQVTKILDCVSICASQLSQHAALFGLQNSAEWKDAKKQLMYKRAGAFESAIGRGKHGYEIAAMGAYFAYLQHPYSTLSATSVAQFLASEANLLALPGEMFGNHQERYLRVAFANVDEAAMEIIAGRLAQFTP